MTDFALAWTAFRNMLRTAAADPLWAIIAIIAGPFRIGRYLIQNAVFLILVVMVLGFGLMAIMQAAGIKPGNPLGIVANLAYIVFLVLFLFRVLTRPMIDHFGDMDAGTHGSARFASRKEVAPLTRAASGLLIGRDGKTGKLLRYDGPAHLLTMAPTRTGKGVGTIIPNLLTADRSVICIDPKGENAKIAGRAREKFGPVHILDPFAVTGRSSAAFNPLDMLDPAGLDAAEDAATLADALVFDEPGMAGEAHWNEEAKALIAGLILHSAASEPRDRRTLATLRENLKPLRRS
jgi:type IV secretion system protein VirD4